MIIFFFRGSYLPCKNLVTFCNFFLFKTSYHRCNNHLSSKLLSQLTFSIMFHKKEVLAFKHHPVVSDQSVPTVKLLLFRVHFLSCQRTLNPTDTKLVSSLAGRFNCTFDVPLNLNKKSGFSFTLS